MKDVSMYTVIVDEIGAPYTLLTLKNFATEAEKAEWVRHRLDIYDEQRSVISITKE